MGEGSIVLMHSVVILKFYGVFRFLYHFCQVIVIYFALQRLLVLLFIVKYTLLQIEVGRLSIFDSLLKICNTLLLFFELEIGFLVLELKVLPECDDRIDSR